MTKSRCKSKKLLRKILGYLAAGVLGGILLRRPPNFQIEEAVEFMIHSSNNPKSSVAQEQRKTDVAAVRTVHFIGREQLDLNDFFSATWLQPLKTFLAMDVNGILIVEDGCFQAYRKDNAPIPTARMTLDWLDFSVEHMSKWWKQLDVFGMDSVPFNKAITSFETYARNIEIDEHGSPLKNTFAVIAFQPYLDRSRPDRARTLTIASMAATMASLIQIGFGRVIVVGYSDKDSVLAQDTFRFLRDTIDPDANHTWTTQQEVTMIGPTEVGYLQVTKEEANSRFIKTNMPKGALVVLQRGFKGNLDEKRAKQLFGSTHDRSFWRYIFLTEPDTILQTRPWALPQLRDALDQGFILTPHRLQPLPHESDVIGMGDEPNKFVPATGNFSSVINLKADAACCDEHKGTYKPGKDNFPDCGMFWWQCGFKPNGNDERLKPYSLIRLQSGTGIVSLAATEHGRRCFPKRSSSAVCK